MMINAILQYMRSWFPSEREINSVSARKRRSSEAFSTFGNAKYRKIASPLLPKNFEDEFLRESFLSSTMTRRPVNSMLHSIVLEDEDEEKSRTTPRRSSLKSPPKPADQRLANGSSPSPKDEVEYVKSTTEKRQDKNGSYYITNFTPIKATTRPPKQQNGAGSSNSSSNRNSSFLTARSLNHSFRLDDKKKYQQLLDNLSFTSPGSFYGTPSWSLSKYDRLNTSRRLVDLNRSRRGGKKAVEVVDLTEEEGGAKARLSTKDTVMKVLGDFETHVIDDSDSDLEVLPSPPSPKPDIRVEPVNSLKTVVDTSAVTKPKWLEDHTKKHETYVQDKAREIQVFAENCSSLSEINRNIVIGALSKRVQDSLAIKDTVLPIIEIEEDAELPPLTGEQLALVKSAFRGNPNDVLTKKFNLNVTKRDLQTLSGLNWLNDNVINFYMNLIIERGNGETRWPRAYAMNTFFYQKLSTSGPESLRRWTRKVDVFAHEFICVPIHLGMHWCMAIVNLPEKTIKYYDSMGHANNQCLAHLKGYLEYEHMDKKNEPFSTEDFKLENVKNIPQQMNGSDCGMFACTFAEFATRKAKFSFDQGNMPYLRQKMVVEIVTGQLLIQ